MAYSKLSFQTFFCVLYCSNITSSCSGKLARCRSQWNSNFFSLTIMQFSLNVKDIPLTFLLSLNLQKHFYLWFFVCCENVFDYMQTWELTVDQTKCTQYINDFLSQSIQSMSCHNKEFQVGWLWFIHSVWIN